MYREFRIDWDPDVTDEPGIRHPGLRVQGTDYGWVLSDADGLSEFQITVQFSCRQDGRTAWAVVLTMIDGDVTVCSGKCATPRWAHEVEDAIRHLTIAWLPQYRINAEGE